jgi:hypothetical protein
MTIPLSLERAMIARRFRRRFLKAFECALEPFSRPKTEEVIPMADQRIGLGNAKAVAALGLMDNPRAAVLQDAAHFSDGDVHSVTRDGRAAPRLSNQLVEIDDTAAMRRQRAQHIKRLRPHPEFGAVAEQAIGRNVDGEGPEGQT